MTTLGGLAQVDSDYKTTGIGIVEGVFSAAKGSNGGTWLNNFYDDEGWVSEPIIFSSEERSS